MIAASEMVDRMLHSVSRAIAGDATRRVADSRADAELRDCTSDLAARGNDGRLTDDERAEYELALTVSTFVSILRAKCHAQQANGRCGKPAGARPGLPLRGVRRAIVGTVGAYHRPMIKQTTSTRLLTEAALLTECRVEHYRGSGSGGQKRNKTSNAVRLTHRPTRISATGTEARSTVENHLHAVRRLRLKLAAEVREPVELARFEPPDWFLSVRREQHVEASHRHPLYAAVGGLTLDLLRATAGNPAAVAANLGVTTTTVIKRLEAEPVLWAAATGIRAEFGLPPLAHRGERR